MKPLFFFLACIAIFSCSRDPNSLLTKRLPAFSVTVIDRSAQTAIIQWIQVTNPISGDSVKYKVRLNGRLVDSNRTAPTDTLHGLSPDTAYSGRVYAYTISGDSVSAPFFLESVNGFIFLGDNGGSISCYNAYTNVLVWQSTYSAGGFNGIPTIVNGVVYANSAQSGTWAFDAKTGATVWHTAFPNDYYQGGSANPLYANGNLYTPVASGVYAMNSTTGAVIWRYPNTQFSANPVLTANGLLILAQRSSSSAIVALDANTGTRVWADTVHTQICANPALIDNLLIFGGSNGNIYALNSSTGAMVWTKNLNITSDVFGSAITSPAIYQDLVIVHNRTSGYYGLKASTGTVVWNYPLQTTDVSTPVVGNGKVYFACSEYPAEKAVALNAANGQIAWKHVFSIPMGSADPVYAHNRLYFGPTLGGYGILELNATTGDEIGVYANWVQMNGTETVVDADTTYYLTTSGMLQ